MFSIRSASEHKQAAGHRYAQLRPLPKGMEAHEIHPMEGGAWSPTMHWAIYLITDGEIQKLSVMVVVCNFI